MFYTISCNPAVTLFSHSYVAPPPHQFVATSLSIPVSHFKKFIRLLYFFKISHVSDAMHYLSFSVWLISFRKVPSKSIHVVANGKIFILFFSFYDQVVFHCVSIYLLMDNETASIPWQFVNNAPMSTGVHVSFRMRVFVVFRHIPRSEITGLCGVL